MLQVCKYPDITLSRLYEIPVYVIRRIQADNILILELNPNFNQEFSKILRNTLLKFLDIDIITPREFFNCKEKIQNLLNSIEITKDDCLLFYEWKDLLNDSLSNIKFEDHYCYISANNDLLYLAYPNPTFDVSDIYFEGNFSYITFRLPASNWKKVGNLFYKN